MLGITFIRDNWANLTSLACALGLTALLYGQMTFLGWENIRHADGGFSASQVIGHLPLGSLITTISVFAILGSIGLYVASQLAKPTFSRLLTESPVSAKTKKSKKK